MNIKDIKTSLTSLVDAEVVNQYRKSGKNISTMLLKRFDVQNMDSTDKKRAIKVVENHLSVIEAPKPHNPLDTSSTISELIGGITTLNHGLIDKKASFENDFFEKQRVVFSGKHMALKTELNQEILSYMDNMGDWTNDSVLRILPTGANQVTYPDLFEGETYPGPKENFIIEGQVDLNNIKNLIRMSLDSSEGQSPDAVRCIGESRISIDFEDYGYHFYTSHPLSEFTKLNEINESIKSLEKEGDLLKEKSKNSHNISYMLGNLSDHLESYYGNDVSKIFSGQGKQIQSLCLSVADNYLNTSAQANTIVEILSIFDGQVFGEIIQREIRDLLPQVVISHETILEHCQATRKALFSHVDISEIEKEFDLNVDTAVELHKAGDDLGFKRHYNKLNPIEKIALEFKMNENTEPTMVESNLDNKNDGMSI